MQSWFILPIFEEQVVLCVDLENQAFKNQDYIKQGTVVQTKPTLDRLTRDLKVTEICEVDCLVLTISRNWYIQDL